MKVNSLQIYSTTLAFNNDLLTPIAAYLKLNKPDAFFLESVEKGHAVGQYSMIGMDPLVRVQGYSDYVTYYHDDEQIMLDGNPLDHLETIYKSINHVQKGKTPIKLGFFGFFGWDVIQAIEKLHVKSSNSPVFDLQIPRVLIVFDHAQQLIYITCTDTEAVNHAAQIESIFNQMKTPLQDTIHAAISKPSTLDWDKVSTNWSKEGYESAVLKIKDHIKEGDIFQGVLSQRFTVPCEKDSLSVYRALRHINPSPYMFYFNYGDYKLIGSSPEILVKSNNGVATLRPIAGTRKRTYEHEDELVKDLKADDKEVAEHIMLVDLGRNDLGRVCFFDTIKVNDLMTIEQYSHVIHMVSNVTGKLKSSVSPIDLFKATFPAGTVSGAPKIKAIEIINDLEPDSRGVYSGSVGYFNFDGDCDFCIAIRTILQDDRGYHVQAGAGIVNDSVPESEYNETKNKAQGVLMACFNGDSA
jgi:anthranilate synthase component 1